MIGRERAQRAQGALDGIDGHAAAQHRVGAERAVPPAAPRELDREDRKYRPSSGHTE